MNKKAEFIIIIIILFITICLSGCWDRRDIERYTLVKGIAIDKTKENRIKFSVQIITPTKSTGDGNTGSGYNIATTTGFNLYDANRNLIKITGKKPFYGHSEIIIISEEIAREGIAPYLDYFIREPEIRGRSLIAITRGKACEILKQPHIIEPIPATGLRYMIDGLSISGSIITMDLINFLRLFFNDNTDPVASSIELRKSNQSAKNEESPAEMLYTNGGAIFRKDILVDWLTRKEARGLNWIIKTGEIRGPILVYPPDEAKENKIAIEVLRSTSKVKTTLINDNFEINVYIESEGFIIEDNSSKYYILKEKNLKQLNKRYTQVIKNEILNTLKKSQKYGADIFGFGEAIYREYPEEFLKIKNNWRDIYKDITVNIEVIANIRRTGMLKEGVDTHEK